MLFDMNQLFQSCLGSVLDGCLPPGYQLRMERPRYFLSLDHTGHRRFQMKPDFCIMSQGRVVAVIDAKWKRLAPASTKGTWGIQQGDMYQLHAYATAYDCSRVALWYPANEDTDGRTERPAFRFLIAGRAPAAATVAVDWIGLHEDLRGRHWVTAIRAEVAAGLERIGISTRAAASG